MYARLHHRKKPVNFKDLNDTTKNKGIYSFTSVYKPRADDGNTNWQPRQNSFGVFISHRWSVFIMCKIEGEARYNNWYY